MAQLNLMGSPRIVFAYLNQASAGLPDPEAQAGSAALPVLRNAHGLPRHISLLHVEDCGTDTVPLNPRRLFWILSQRVPPRTRLYADAGNAFFWALHYWHPRGERVLATNRMPVSMGFAAMGWAIGAAIGGKLADPRDPVLCITGDGSYLMNAQEISVAQQLGLNVVYLVLNNGVLGTVKHGQRMRGLQNTANELPPTDFALMARAMGVELPTASAVSTSWIGSASESCFCARARCCWMCWSTPKSHRRSVSASGTCRVLCRFAPWVATQPPRLYLRHHPEILSWPKREPLPQPPGCAGCSCASPWRRCMPSTRRVN